MSKTNLVHCLMRPNNNLSPAEMMMLEMKLFTHICNELSVIYTSRYHDYQRLIKSNFYQEESMCGIKFMQEIIKDILSTEEYSLAGIANHTHIPEDVLTDLATGINTNPTFELSKKLFELHIRVRREMYDGIMKKAIYQT